MGKIKQYLKDVTRGTSIFILSVFFGISFFVALAAISWPNSTPAGETNGGTIMSYINNMLTSDCGSGEAMYGFNANGTKKCRAFSTGPAITYSWNTTGWSSCSVSCGGGSQTRTVTCKGSDGSTAVDSSCTGTKPAATQSCNTSACSVPVIVINGSCGTAQGQSYSTPPTTGLCSQGTQSTVTTGTTTYSWTCAGSNGGTTANCTANIKSDSGSQEWTTPGTYTWTVPAGVTSVNYEVVGGGGGGGGAWRAHGGGGGSGGRATGVLVVVPGTSISLKVGTRGAGGVPTASAGVAGGNGGTSIFGTVSVTGGVGGKAPVLGSVQTKSLFPDPETGQYYYTTQTQYVAGVGGNGGSPGGIAGKTATSTAGGVSGKLGLTGNYGNGGVGGYDPPNNVGPGSGGNGQTGYIKVSWN